MTTYHIPGYNYCGPGTKDFSKIPVNKLDSLCRTHDLSYNKSFYRDDKKVSPYTHYTPGDEELRIAAGKLSGIAAGFVSSVFAAKKVLANPVSIIQSTLGNFSLNRILFSIYMIRSLCSTTTLLFCCKDAES